ncbi:MAG TPA: hypothetical protein VF412_11725 [Bdellovibrio sp.]|uniref:hypothetical protein n=1 Tax=Bdellovibrio sp. TaxID=28201 RepID=UPI002EF44B6B
MEKISLNQKDNYHGNFGEVLRSSSNFYYRHDEKFRTTLSFFNYWHFKNDNSVTLVANIRRMDGTLLRRERLKFEQGEVINYRPSVNTPFEGSVEIESFSLQNLRIPYSAVMAFYETEKSIVQVHSYSRVYSLHEVEDKKILTHGRESCWTIYDNLNIRSFGVFHNGFTRQQSQVISLTVTRLSDGKKISAKQELFELQPYQTVKIYPADIIPNLSEFLRGEAGNVSINFEVSNGFTRMLVGNEVLNESEFYATHSNFNYSQISTDSLERGIAYMKIPSLEQDVTVLIYPDMDPGSYKATTDDKIISFKTGDFAHINLSSNLIETVKFEKNDGRLPSRIVTALTGQQKNHILPWECSLGVFHNERPAKRYFWGPYMSSSSAASTLVLTPYEEIYGAISSQDTLTINLYSSAKRGSLTTKILTLPIIEQNGILKLDDLFPNLKEFLDNDYGYYSIYSTYGGLLTYTAIQKPNGAFTIEHSF